MVKIAHECPNALFKQVQLITDYDYCLIHKLDEDIDYQSKFMEAVSLGREVILDNSIFELGEAYDQEAYRWWIRHLEPTYYIIPDVLNNAEGTTHNLKEWRKDVFGIDHIKSIGVIQGNTFEELVLCYESIAPSVNKVAIPFDSNSFQYFHPNKWASMALGRAMFVFYLIKKYGKELKPLHLLGCANPVFELHQYKNTDAMSYIDSIDTSSPIVHGMNNIKYDTFYRGDWQKITSLVSESLDWTPSVEQVGIITGNIMEFRKMLHG